jgi:hypothetical protein
MTSFQLAKRAIRHYSWDLAPKHINRANQRAWLRSITMLGDRWLLAKPIKREVLQ